MSRRSKTAKQVASRLKKLRFVLIVGVLIAAGVGFLKLKHSHDYEANAAEINLLLARARAKGFATAGEVFVKKLPDAENAWIDIAPILMKHKSGDQNRYFYANEYAGTLLASGLSSDKTIIQESLDLNRSNREAILSALKSKRGFQVPRNYNEGYAMLFPDRARLKTLTNDICLDALAHAMHRDSEGTLSRMDAAYLIGSELMSHKDELSRLVALSIFSIISRADLRIVEVDPTMLGPIKDQAKSWAPKFEQDPYDVFEWYFLEQMATCRNFDEPVMDGLYPGFPLDKLIKAPDPEKIDNDARIQPGDAIPKSPAMRRYMVTLLRQWTPVINQIKDPSTKHDVDTADAMADKIDRATDCPKPLKDLLTALLEGNVSVSALFSSRTKIDLLFEALRQVEYKQTHGKYADRVLGQIRLSDPTMKFKVTKRGNGIMVGSGSINDDGLAQTRICVPVSAGLSRKVKEPTTITQLRKGTLKVNGSKSPAQEP